MTYSDVLLNLVATLDLPPDVDTPHLQIFNPATAAMETLTLSGPAGPSYAPLCTGDAAPTIIGTGDGQPVLVPIL